MLHRWHRSIVLATTFLLAGLAIACSPLPAAADVIPWAPDLETAQARASREGRLVLIHFWADDCPPCRRLEANVFSQPEVAQAITSRYVPVKVHATRRSDLSRRFGVDRWPTDVVITPSGQKITSMVSPQDPRQYIQAFTQVAARMMPPLPPTQTAGLAPPAPREPYSTAATNNDLYNAAGPRAAAAPGRSPHGSSAGEAYIQHNTPWNTGIQEPERNSNYRQQTAGGYGSDLGGNAYAAQSPDRHAPRAAAADYGSRYGSRYGAAYGANTAPPGDAAYRPNTPPPNQVPATGYGAGPAYDQPMPRGQAAPGQYGAAPQMAAAPAPQSSGYQPSYASAAHAPQPQGPTSAPAHGAQAIDNRYAPAAQAAAEQANPNQRRQVWEWNNESQQPPASTAQAADAAMQSPPMQPAYQANPQPSQPPVNHRPVASQPPVAPVQQAGHPPIALDGYCPVALNGAQPAWVQGDPRFGAVHRGRTYLFTSAAAQQQFLADPDRFAPALSGYDPVRFVEEKKIVPGTRAFGWFYQDRYYLFADEAGLRRFEKSPEHYHEVVQQAMRRPPGQSQPPASQYR